MQRIVPTSDSASGESSLPTVSISPVGVPGLKTDVPLYISTWTSFPATIAAPTSRSLSAGWPIAISLVFGGTKRTRPGGGFSWELVENGAYLRVNDGIDMILAVYNCEEDELERSGVRGQRNNEI